MKKAQLKAIKRQKAEDKFAQICRVMEFARFTDGIEWFSGDPIKKAYLYAVSKYITKGAIYDKKITFGEYCEALSREINNGLLKEARMLGEFPEYDRLTAKKYNIGKNCGSIGTGDIYGYE